MVKRFNKISIVAEATLLNALKQMDEISRKLLLVFDADKFIGLLSVGDIQRAIIKNVDLRSPVTTVLQTKGRIVARPEDPIEETKKVMLMHRTEFMPVVDKSGELVNVLFWEDFFKEEQSEISVRFDLPVVVMAGGTGNRLRPLTYVLPKPLLPINDRTMLEEIFIRFNRYGSNRFYISVNYKAELIKYYIKSLNLDYLINYIEEDKPCGTAGSLSLIKGKISDTLFVTNCDNLIDQDYHEILDYHKAGNNEITVVAAIKHFPIAYGTIDTEGNGSLLKMVEKPDMTFKINTGMYILEPGLIDEIPENEYYNMTDLIDKLKKQNRNVGVFPVWQSKWIDVGDWDVYMKAIRCHMNL